MKKYQIGLYEKAMPDTLSWKEKFQVASKAGYDYIELSIDATEDKISRIDMNREARLELLSLVNETGISIGSICVSALTKYSLGNENRQLRERGLLIAKKSIDLAADLGARIVMIPGYDIYYGESTYESKRLFWENVKKIVEIAAQAGVTVGFETMENEFMNTVEKAMKYVSLFNSSFLMIYPDIGNLTNASVLYKQDLLEDMELGRGHIVALHLKETIPGRFREIPYGTGHVNFKSGIEKAWSLGVRRYVTEFWYKGSRQWRKDISQVCENFRELLDKME